MRVRIGGWAWLDKRLMPERHVQMVREELTLQPTGYGDHIPAPVEVFEETEHWLGVPRQYYLKKARKRPRDLQWDVTRGRADAYVQSGPFHGELRSGQKKAFNAVLPHFAHPEFLGGFLVADTGWGKCCAKGTKVVKYDGQLVRVEDVTDGMLLMGPDGGPRRVSGVTEGVGPLCRIVPRRGAPWECTDDHILTLRQERNGEVIDVSVGDFKGWSPREQSSWRLFSPSTRLSFDADPEWLVDPYLVGVVASSGADFEGGMLRVRAPDSMGPVLQQYADSWGAVLHRKVSGFGVVNYVFVPQDPTTYGLEFCLRRVFDSRGCIRQAYLASSEDARASLLAGWADCVGVVVGSQVHVVCSQRRRASLVFLARSLGMNAYRYGPSVIIRGNWSSVPLRVSEWPRDSENEGWDSAFEVEDLKEGEWAGFTVDVDGRFLLGDLTVTHNTVWSAALISKVPVPALVLVNNQVLMDQWKEAFHTFLPEAKVGILQQDSEVFEGTSICLAMVQTVWSKRESLGEAFWKWPGLVLTDEAHMYGAEKWSQILPRFGARYRLGVTATLRRKDGMAPIFDWHIGDVLHRARVEKVQPRAKMVRTGFMIPSSSSVNPAMVTENVALSYMVQDEERNRLIVDLVKRAVISGRYVLVLTKRRAHVDILHELLKAALPCVLPLRDKAAARKAALGDLDAQRALFQKAREEGPQRPVVGKCVGGVKGDELEAVKSAQVIVATSQYVATGFNVERLDTLLLVAPMVDVEQAVGRIMREHPEKEEPVVIDLVDDLVDVCAAYAYRRRQFYEQKGYLE